MTVSRDEARQLTREVWTTGDYASVAPHLNPAAGALVERAGVSAGMTVLDVATGTGNAALRAAALGARVTGLELVDELLELAGRRATEAGLDVEWSRRRRTPAIRGRELRSRLAHLRRDVRAQARGGGLVALFTEANTSPDALAFHQECLLALVHKPV